MITAELILEQIERPTSVALSVGPENIVSTNPQKYNKVFVENGAQERTRTFTACTAGT
jgi:hypothetical protein